MRPAQRFNFLLQDALGTVGTHVSQVSVSWTRSMNEAGRLLHLDSDRCPSCEGTVRPVRPPLHRRQYIAWIGLPLLATFLFNGVALWSLVGFILWRNSKGVCPECGHEPIRGSVGWTRESVFLWLLLILSVSASLWFTYFLFRLLIWAVALILE